ncbi:unnamed protein product [Schistosoma mattheei]|uniref:Glycosyl hydrolase family 13 catalytic domain-containing protein n=1 Tax=Schistosoma mattheei TaxID=31246 RepID=A0A183PUA2_9TREM|nr:unnamed protein product [Schistosoma mattheei]
MQVGVTSILLTNLLNSDINGIIDWETINQSIDPTEEGFNHYLPQIIKKSKQQKISILLGLSIYTTSNRHEWFRLSQSSNNNNNNVYSTFYIWTNNEPLTDQQKRHYAYDSIRRAYYRHVHGNPNSPLLNLSNPNVVDGYQWDKGQSAFSPIWDSSSGCICISELMFTPALESSAVRFKRYRVIHFESRNKHQL